jgi:hypothetical protein
VRYFHESQKRGSPEDRVILRWLVHDFEVELFSSIVLAITEADVECYPAQWIVSASWDETVEGTICWLHEL